MVTFGVDVSHHQPALNFVAMRQEGVEFAFIKATEGTFIDNEFGDNLNRARSAGMLVGAYHYQRSNSSAAAQVVTIQRRVPLDVPVLLDVEANSGGVSLTRELVDLLRSVGYRVPLLYLPRWYWQQLGSPSLAGLPPLWSSRYPDNVAGTLVDEYAAVPPSYWNGYGGLAVAVLQFTSSARIAGYQPLDANAFNGTRAQLDELLGGEVAELSDALERALWAGLYRIDALYNNRATSLADDVNPNKNEVNRLKIQLDALTDDEVNVIAAVRDIVAADSNADLTVTPEQVQELADAVTATLSDETREAVREAFARAGQADETGGE